MPKLPTTKEEKESRARLRQFEERAHGDHNLSAIARLVLSTLLRTYFHDTGRCYRSEIDLAQFLGFSDRHIRRAIKELHNEGWVTSKRNFNRANNYFFAWDNKPELAWKLSKDKADAGLVPDLPPKEDGDIDVETVMKQLYEPEPAPDPEPHRTGIEHTANKSWEQTREELEQEFRSGVDDMLAELVNDSQH